MHNATLEETIDTQNRSWIRTNRVKMSIKRTRVTLSKALGKPLWVLSTSFPSSASTHRFSSEQEITGCLRSFQVVT